MPGICGIISGTPQAVDSDLLTRMLARLTHHDWYQVEQGVTPSGLAALGRSSLGFINTEPQPAVSAAGNLWTVLDGEIYDSIAESSQAQALQHGFATSGRDFLRQLEGKFAAAMWDEQQQRLFLINDRFGMKPLYYAHVGGRLLFASEIKSLLADPGVSRQPCKQGLAEFFTFGHMLGESTLLDAVRVLPPAAWLVYDARQDKVDVDRYWRLTEASAAPSSTADSSQVDRLCLALKRAVDRRTLNTAGLGISLSGGLDGRTILAAIDPARVPLKSVCMGMAGSLDHRSAAQLAALAHRDHRTHVLDTGFLNEFERHLRYMVHLTEGQYLDQCIVLPTLPLYRQLGIQVLLRGHAGELLHMDKAYNFSMDREALAIRDEAGLRRWLLARLCAYMLDGVKGSLIEGLDAGEIHALARESLNRAIAESDGLDPLQRISHLFISHRLPRETAMSLAMFNSVVETRVPFLDTDVVQSLFALPPEAKVGDGLQTEFLKRHRPELIKIVNSNTGAPMGAGYVRRRFATFRMKVLGKLGVPGYQPYERLGLWLRRELKPLVRRVLLSEQCLGRGIFSPDVIRSVVQNHENGVSNHTFLLMATMIYELGQREFIDKSLTTASRTAPTAAIAT